MKHRKLLVTAGAIAVLGSVAFAANRVRNAGATDGPRSCTTAHAAAGAGDMLCPYSGKHGTAAANAADGPHDASGNTACPHGAGAVAADCPANKADAQPSPDCCKGKTTTP